mmetsp:Transcript_9733/g.30285  ORF Transcript_9733/g.30285 Transcript_9733/m.30285 type:complete len:229 (+) Transcript_9733:500-1186(+)
MVFSSTDSRLSFSRSTSSSLLSSSSSCSRCCSTSTRRRRLSRSFRAMLPARLDSLIFRKKSPASCSSSWALGIRDCSAVTSSRALATWVVAAMSLSGCKSGFSLASLSESSSRDSGCTEKPRPARPPSKAATPSWTSEAAAARLRSSFSCCFRSTVPSKLMSWFSRAAFTCMFCLQMSMLIEFHSSLAFLFCRKRSCMLKRWISRCSVTRACSRLSISAATISCFCRS